jgi:hypothetical protein
MTVFPCIPVSLCHCVNVPLGPCYFVYLLLFISVSLQPGVPWASYVCPCTLCPRLLVSLCPVPVFLVTVFLCSCVPVFLCPCVPTCVSSPYIYVSLCPISTSLRFNPVLDPPPYATPEMQYHLRNICFIPRSIPPLCLKTTMYQLNPLRCFMAHSISAAQTRKWLINIHEVRLSIHLSRWAGGGGGYRSRGVGEVTPLPHPQAQTLCNYKPSNWWEGGMVGRGAGSICTIRFA